MRLSLCLSVCVAALATLSAPAFAKSIKVSPDLGKYPFSPWF